jgi:hypothetical protein
MLQKVQALREKEKKELEEDMEEEVKGNRKEFTTKIKELKTKEKTKDTSI